jgi:integrase
VPRPNAKRLFSELIDGWRASLRYSDCEPKTIERYEQIMRTYIAPTFGHDTVTAVTAVTRERLKGYIARLSRSGTSPGTIAKVHTVMSAILSEAVDSEIIATNPALGIALPKVPKRKRVVLTAHEVRALANAMLRSQDGLAVYIAAYCGPRADELWALQRQDWNSLHGRLTIQRAFKDHQDRTQIGATKTGDVRTMSVPAFLRAMIDEHVAHVAPAPDAFLFSFPGGSNYVPIGHGGPVRHELWRARVFRPAVIKALPAEKQSLRWHDMRHTCATLMVEAGMHPKLIQQRLGHRDIRTTMNLYGGADLPDADVATALDSAHAAEAGVVSVRAGS